MSDFKVKNNRTITDIPADHEGLIYRGGRSETATGNWLISNLHRLARLGTQAPSRAFLTKNQLASKWRLTETRPRRRRCSQAVQPTQLLKNEYNRDVINFIIF